MATKALSFENFIDTTLNGAITDSDLTITLTNALTTSEGFLVIDPDGTPEIVYYTSRSGNDVTCPSGAGNGRGYDGTTAAAHADGATVKMAPVAAMFEAIQDGTGMADDLLDSQHYAAGSIDTAHIADKQATAEKLGVSSAFKVTLELDISSSDNTVNKIAFDEEMYDINSDWDYDNDEFVAPYDGIYQFDLTWHLDDPKDNDPIRATIKTDNGSPDQVRTQIYSAADDLYHGLSVSGLFKLSAGDKVWAEAYYVVGADQEIAGGTYCRFSGFLVGRT